MKAVATLVVGGCLLSLGALAVGAPPADVPDESPILKIGPAPAEGRPGRSPGVLGTPAAPPCPGLMRDGRCVPFAVGTDPAAVSRPEELLFAGPDPILTEQEQAALELADQWQAGNARSVNFEAKNGVITYKFGLQQPSVVCAVLQLCDIALQQGERITAINLGDTGRWTVESAIAGTDELAVPHVIIKPADVGLETSLVVSTDRRIYHLRLRSHRTRYMPQVAFSYTDGIGLGKKPEKPGRTGAGGRRGATAAPAPPPAPPPAPAAPPSVQSEAEYLSNIDFNYRISGEAPWKPLRVYNDGRRTYIRMPAAATMTTVPTFLVVEPNSANGPPVNYVIDGDSYVVDGLFKKGLLVAGMQPNQTSITIEREGR